LWFTEDIMAQEAYVMVQGKKQGPSRGTSSFGSDSKEIGAFEFGVQSPRDAASGQASGKRQHKPIIITKEWGAASPQLFQALCTNEVLDSIVIQIPGPNKKSPTKIHFKNAHVLQMHYIGAGKYRVSFAYEEAQTLGGTPPSGLL
jgi:type VI secretion system Hcp family effector